MSLISVVICTRNPRRDYLANTLESLRSQTLATKDWEVLLIDNASDQALEADWDLSWHPNPRHIREDELGLTAARLRGIREARGDILVFVDDDNILGNEFLDRVLAIVAAYPHISVCGPGRAEPDFETP